MTAPTPDMGVDTKCLNTTTIGKAITSPVDHTADGELLESNTGTDDTKDQFISPEELNVMEAISKAMSKVWAALIANRDQTAVRLTAYRGSGDRTVDVWLLLMKLYLEQVCSNASPLTKLRR